MKKINWAIIAPGNIAKDFATALRGVANANAYSVASRDPKKAAAFASEFGFDTSAKSYEELLADPNIDVVYRASPHSFHVEQSMACLKAGKAVLCEKPMAINAREADAVFALAKERGLFYMEAVWTRLMPVLHQVRQWLDEGRIGEVEMVQASFGFGLPFDASHRLYNKDLGGGALLDVGIYPITFAQWVMQQAPTKILAMGSIGQSGVDEKNAALLSYPNGAIANLNSAINSHTSQEAWIYGSKGKIHIPKFWYCREATLFEGQQQTPLSIPHRINGYEYEIEEVNNCLSQGLLESPGMPWHESASVMQIMDEVRQQIGLQYSNDI